MVERKLYQNNQFNRRTLIIQIKSMEQMIKRSDIEQNQELIIIDIEGEIKRQSDNSTELTNK